MMYEGQLNNDEKLYKCLIKEQEMIKEQLIDYKSIKKNSIINFNFGCDDDYTVRILKILKNEIQAEVLLENFRTVKTTYNRSFKKEYIRSFYKSDNINIIL